MVDRDLKEKVEGTLHPDFAIGGGKKRRQTLSGLGFPKSLNVAEWQSVLERYYSIIKSSLASCRSK